MFRKAPSLLARVLALTLVSLVLFASDYFLTQQRVSHAVLGSVATPFYWLADIPRRIGDWGEQNWANYRALAEENNRLRSEARVLKANVQKMSALVAENGQLRALLHSSSLLEGDDIEVVELIGVVPDTDRHEVVINKGTRHGVYQGQPVLDAYGLMGQVVAVSPGTSRVILISDASHALPAQLVRTGLRIIVVGVGAYDKLRLDHVALTADINVGDILVSSGLGGRFPAGYPVAQVASIERVASQAFLSVTATPTAQLDRSRHLLLVYPKGRFGDSLETTPVPVSGAGTDD